MINFFRGPLHPPPIGEAFIFCGWGAWLVNNLVLCILKESSSAEGWSVDISRAFVLLTPLAVGDRDNFLLTSY